MSEHNRAKGHHDQKRRAKREAVNALYFAVVEAIESAPSPDAPIEVPASGVSLEVVNAVIARFEGSGWNVELKKGEPKLSATAANIDNTSTPRPPRPPYQPPQPITPTPPLQPVFEPGNVPPPTSPVPNPGALPPVVPPGREPEPMPPGQK